MKIKCIAVDDEPLALRQLAAYIKKVPFLDLVAECRSAIEARTVMEQDVADVLFIDIDMPDLNGLDFVRSLVAPPIVVFTTAYSDYAIEGYKVDAVYYLLKPFGLEEFQRAAMKVKKRYELENYTQVTTMPDSDDTMFFKTEHRVVRVDPADIRYIESMSEYLKIYTDNQKPIVVLLSMKKIEERLPSYFMRIHRSYIVNLRKIQEVNKSRIVLDAETYLPLGDLYREAFTNYLNKKFIGK